VQDPPRRSRYWLRWFAAVTAIIIIGLSIFPTPLIHLLMLFVTWNDSISFDKVAALPAVTQIMNGSLKPDANGVVKLPPALGKLSLYDEAYVTTDASGVVWVLFRTWQGKGTNLHGFVHRSTPAAGPVPASIAVLGPTPTDPPTEKVDYVVDQQIDPNWYEVRFDLN
jgi:hypothetical protein